jgi:hypothetical protein
VTRSVTPCRLGFEAGLLGPVADDEQARAGLGAENGGHRGDHIANTLFLDQASDEQQQRTAVTMLAPQGLHLRLGGSGSRRTHRNAHDVSLRPGQWLHSRLRD